MWQYFTGLQTVDPSTSGSCALPHDFNETFLRNICLFYLKLQGQLLLPASTFQIVVEEIQNVHELGQDFTRSKLHSLLKDDMGLADDAAAKICDCVKDSDLSSACHWGPLRTTYSRTQTFKKMFKYIEPKKNIIRDRWKQHTEVCLLHSTEANITHPFRIWVLEEYSDPGIFHRLTGV